jgi:hypothetical protein
MLPLEEAFGLLHRGSVLSLDPPHAGKKTRVLPNSLALFGLSSLFSASVRMPIPSTRVSRGQLL